MDFILWSWLQQKWRLPEIEKFKGAVPRTDGQKVSEQPSAALPTKAEVKENFGEEFSASFSHTDLPFTPLLVLLTILVLL